MIIPDTTVWIDHLRFADPRVERLSATVQLMMHPFVLGELVLGSLAQRSERIRQWRDLPSAKVLRHDDLLKFVEAHRLYSRGIGYTDLNLLASAATSDGIQIWTRDRRLGNLADEFAVLAKLDD